MTENKIDTNEYAFILGATIDSIGLINEEKKEKYDHIILLSDLDLEKINEGYDINVEGSDISYLKGEKYISIAKQKLEDKTLEINEQFDNTISEYLSKYPKREQDTFSEKKREAEKVLLGESSIYIEGKAKALGITKEQFANIIIQKNNEWVTLYMELENEKDAEIIKLKSEYEL